MHARHVIAALFAMCPLAGAGVLTVGDGTPGSFADLQAAVAASQSGDVIRVVAGSFDSPGMITIDKPLTIIGAGSQLSLISAGDGSLVDGSPAMLIRNLTAGDEVRVVGLHLRNSVPFSIAPTALQLANNHGAVLLGDLELQTGYGKNEATRGACQIFASDYVVMDGCTILPLVNVASGLAPDGNLLGQAGLHIEDSQIELSGCTISGSSASDPVLVVMHGGPGIRALDSTLRISRSKITGGAGSDEAVFPPTSVAGNGGPGVASFGGLLSVRGGAGNLIRGGDGGGKFVPVLGKGGPGISLSASSFGTTSADALILGGLDGGVAPSAPPVLAQGATQAWPEALSTLALSPRVAAPGANVDLEFGAQPGSLYMPFYSLDLGPPRRVAGVVGDLVLDHTMLVSLPPVTIDTAGVATATVTLPTLSGLVGAVAIVQGLAISPTSLASIASPSLLGIQ